MNTKTMNIKEFQQSLKEKEQWRKDHPVRAFGETLWIWVSFRLWDKIGDGKRAVKWAWQRVFRGYDDCMVWNYCHYNAEITLAILKQLQKNKVGSPYTHDPDGVLKTPDTPTDHTGVNDDWHKRWDEALDIMIEGWEAYIAMDEVHIEDENGDYDFEATRKEEDRLHEIWKKGMTLYVANYGGMWD